MKSVATFAVVLVLACATANAFVLDRDIAAAVARATGGNATDAAFTWEDCCSSSCKASNMQITIDPANPQKGQDYTYSSSYDLSEDVTGGKATYKITLRGIPISDKTDDLCTDLKSTDTPCPIKAGHVSSVTKGNVPSSTPSGKLVARTSWTDQNGDDVLCVQLTFDIQ